MAREWNVRWNSPSVRHSSSYRAERKKNDEFSAIIHFLSHSTTWNRSLRPKSTRHTYVVAVNKLQLELVAPCWGLSKWKSESHAIRITFAPCTLACEDSQIVLYFCSHTQMARAVCAHKNLFAFACIARIEQAEIFLLSVGEWLS